MQFVRGNKAVRDHFKDGKEVYLFSYGQRRGWVRYVGQMVCTGFHFKIAPDLDGNARRAIVFELTPIEEFLHSSLTEEEEDLGRDSLEELRRKALASSVEGKNASERKSLVRLRSQAIKLYILKRAGGICEGCNEPAPFQSQTGEPYLEAHHIRRLSDGGPDDPRWVIAVCPNCHRRAHYSGDCAEFNASLGEEVEKLEEQYQ